MKIKKGTLVLDRYAHHSGKPGASTNMFLVARVFSGGSLELKKDLRSDKVIMDHQPYLDDHRIGTFHQHLLPLVHTSGEIKTVRDAVKRYHRTIINLLWWGWDHRGAAWAAPI